MSKKSKQQVKSSSAKEEHPAPKSVAPVHPVNQFGADIKANVDKLPNKIYVKELAKLQIELVKLQEWVKEKGLKVVVLFEGRDAAGKGGTIKRITESLNPRVARAPQIAVALVVGHYKHDIGFLPGIHRLCPPGDFLKIVESVRDGAK